MQQRRLRPGDVLDDYCPRERRVTDHAIVAMIEDKIKQTRCVVCDAEHEYKQAKVPPQRKKKAPALFTQVLDGLQGPARPPHLPDAPADDQHLMAQEEEPQLAQVVATVSTVTEMVEIGESVESSLLSMPAPRPIADGEPVLAAAAQEEETARPDESVDGPFRRRLIRAALPRSEGIPPSTRVIPEFTVRQAMNGRASRHASGRRRGPHQQTGQNGSTRFGRGAPHGQRSNGQRSHDGHSGPHGNRMGRSRRGGKKR